MDFRFSKEWSFGWLQSAELLVQAPEGQFEAAEVVSSLGARTFFLRTRLLHPAVAKRLVQSSVDTDTEQEPLLKVVKGSPPRRRLPP